MRRRHTLPSLIIIALFVLSACGLGGNPESVDSTNTGVPTSDANGSTEEPVTISFAVYEFEREAYEPLVEQFNTNNPDMHVQLISTDESDYAQGFVSFADTANMILSDNYPIETRLLANLTPLMDADTSFDRDDFYPGAFGPVSERDSIYMLPSTMQVNLLFYNKDLWTASGISEPSLDWNWNDMIAAAEQLAQTRGNDIDVYGLLESSGETLFLLNALNESGVDPLQTPAEEIQLDDPNVIAALERMKVLAESGAIFVGDPTTSFDGLTNLILDQRVAMWSSDLISVEQVSAEIPFEVGVLPYPSIQHSAFERRVRGFMMRSDTQYPEQSWRWLSFISQQKIENPFQQDNVISVIPAHRSIAEQTGYWDNIDEETANVIQTVVERSAEPVSNDFRDIVSLFQVLNTAAKTIMREEQNPKEALREAQASFEERITKTLQIPQLTPTAEAKAAIVSTPVADIVPEGATTITFNTSFVGAYDIQALASTFNENNPDLFVEITTPDFSVDGGVSLESIAASADCFSWWDAPNTNEFRATLDLQPLINADATFDQEDYPVGLLEPFRHSDGLYGLPYAVNFRTLYYRPSMFEAAGLEPPTADWMLDDFLNAAQQLTSGSGNNKQYGYASNRMQTRDLDYFINQLGAEVTTDNNTQPNFTDPSVIEATKSYVDLINKFSPHEKLSGYTNDGLANETFILINDGRVGMWLIAAYITRSEIEDDTITLAPPPLPSSSFDSGSIDFTGLYISAETENADACWRWINYLSQNTTDLAGNYPARTSVVESDAFAAEAGPDALEVYNAYRESLNETDSLANQSEFDFEQIVVERYWYYRAVDRAIQGGDLERELVKAQQLTESYLLCRQNGADAHTCATQVDPDYDGFLQPVQEDAEAADE